MTSDTSGQNVFVVYTLALQLCSAAFTDQYTPLNSGEINVDVQYICIYNADIRAYNCQNYAGGIIFA